MSSYTFDPRDLITQIVDSIAGTTMRQYDQLDDLTEEQNAQAEDRLRPNPIVAVGTKQRLLCRHN